MEDSVKLFMLLIQNELCNRHTFNISRKSPELFENGYITAMKTVRRLFIDLDKSMADKLDEIGDLCFTVDGEATARIALIDGKVVNAERLAR